MISFWVQEYLGSFVDNWVWMMLWTWTKNCVWNILTRWKSIFWVNFLFQIFSQKMAAWQFFCCKHDSEQLWFGCNRRQVVWSNMLNQFMKVWNFPAISVNIKPHIDNISIDISKINTYNKMKFYFLLFLSISCKQNL